MTIKQRLELLNTLRLGLKDKVVLFIREGHQIHGAIIRFNAIQVMNYPAFWHKFPMQSFPHKNMLRDVSLIISSGMPSCENKDVAVCCHPTALPISRMFPPRQIFSSLFTGCPGMFHTATTAANSCSFNAERPFPSVYWCITIWAKLRYILAPIKIITTITSQCRIAAGAPAIDADMCMVLFPLLALLFRPHGNIVAGCYANGNYFIGGNE